MSQVNSFYLLRERNFLPLFITQFCGAFNDNFLKSTLSFLITYQAVHISFLNPAMLINLALGLFVLPFVIFGGISGQVADKYEKSLLVKLIKVFEIFIIILAIYGFRNDNIIVLLGCLFLMGVHSTFFGPLKYSIIPEHVEKDELIAANSLIEAGTFVSILLGTLIGSVASSYRNGLVEFVMLFIAIIGLISSCFIPKTQPGQSEMKINRNFLKENINIIQYSLGKKNLYLSILGISWFWFISSTFISQIPVFAKDILMADKNVANIFFAIFSVGVAIGSMLCNKIMHKEITSKYVFLSSIGISLFGIDIYFASSNHISSSELIDLFTFLQYFNSWRILFDILMLSVIGGVYAVPLFAIMQYFSSQVYRSRVIAANNIFNSAFMVASALMVMVLIILGFNVAHIFLIISFLNVVVAIYSYHLIPDARIIPQPLLRMIFKFIFNKLYRVKIKGIENYHKAGDKVVIISNHISYLDPALLSVYLPDDLIFAINTDVAKLWWVKPFLNVVKTYAVDPTNSMAAKNLINEVKKNKKIAIFPEGRLSVTGALMKVYEGPGMIADKSGAVILPIRIYGPQFTYFSKVRKFAKTRIFPTVTITILPPVTLDLPEHLDNRERRKFISHKLYDIMSEMMFESSDYRKRLFESLIDSAKMFGYNRKIINDMNNNVISYRQLIARSFILGNFIANNSRPLEAVGVMMPNTSTTVIVFYAIQSFGRVPAMINFSAGALNVISSCKAANVKTIYTSSLFIEKANLYDLVDSLSKEFKIVYLEDLRSTISIKQKLTGLIASYFPQTYYNKINHNSNSSSPAVILFTSGTEGRPKAVVLSHSNLQANIWQMAARVDFGIHDRAFNALPMFHSFGLTAATLLPINFGIKTFFYPSPLHYRIIPEIVYDLGITIMFGTDTFLNGYASYADPYDFYSLRYVFAGAEKLKPQTRKLWFDKYGVRIFEGYGATEASPVVSVNTPMHDRPGTVGRAVPSLQIKIKPVAGILEGGKLYLKGPNIMLGYMYYDNPGVVVAPGDDEYGDGWYDTGDIVKIDSDGYLTIQGRVKRFAKIAGEMISLLLVESSLFELYPDYNHAVVNNIDDERGEGIVLFTTCENIERAKMVEFVKAKGISELHVPKHVIYMKEIPILNSGKVDYNSLNQFLADKRA